MMCLMKAELYKFKRDISVWIISLTLICCAGISIFTGVYSSVENAVLNLGKDYMGFILAFAVYAGFSCTDDFTNRTVIYAITYGNKRFQILLVKCCRYILGCTIIIVSNMTVFMMLSLLALGTETALPDLLIYAVKSLLLSLPLFWAIAVIACSIIGVVFTNKAYFSMQQPNSSLLRFSPVVQLPMIYEQTLSACDYWGAISISIFMAVIILSAGTIIFNQAEL